ncbi:TetR family transcriptional regulator [Sneathiella sp. P13V-1]|uniref:TetR/AcrR family transcriptional regulator n=1 Tax=Sneathiella sp. P13V-1 TaxID=2697366 RepID=UPI00187B68B7|nr:TetR/AcrR family transcriptional regulator [Sneathiella sp. P13V-1]MBE7638287.1 TetR family transcriptional regulator [Sneathiella sp. P13V-1]
MVHAKTKERIDAILDFAEEEMRRGGYDAVSFRDIAKAVDIKSSSVHYHFPQKSDLGKAVIERYGDRFLEALGDPKRFSSIKEGVQALGDAYLASLKQANSVCLACMLGSESPSLPEELRPHIQSFYKKVSGWTETVLDKRKDSPLGATFIIGSLQGSMALAVSQQDSDILKSTIQQLVKMAE